MKKIYSAPLTKVVKIKPVQIICTSPEGFTKGLAGVESAKLGGDALDKDCDFDDSGDLW